MRGSIARCNVGVKQLADVPDLGHAVEQLQLTRTGTFYFITIDIIQ
jgi:hypothetical protein